MAGQIPDPRTLNSWQDAFQHPLPVVRKLEQQLRKNIDDNRQKLRSLVGASYRDLLGTAERIIEMDQQMETVESNLGDIGRRCNARTVERIAENGAQMRKTLNSREGDKYAAMAQTKMLQSALTMVLRILKSGGDALQAAKLLVLSRLLFKSVSEGSHIPAVLEELRRKLAMLRRRLLSYITTAMVKPTEDKNVQVNTLCAYALVTSSTPKEVLRHFLQVRYEQLDNRSDSQSEDDILEMLDLYSQTLLDTRDLFPRRFSESLTQFAKLPLIRDQQIQSVFELNLDTYGQWIAEEVRTFTPWVRHDQLGSIEVSDALASWTKQAQECLLRDVQDFAENQSNAGVVAGARRKVVSKYMSLSGKLRNEDHMKTIHAIRETFLQRLQELAIREAAFGDLEFNETEDRKEPEMQSMWELAAEDLDLSHGALKFRRSIVQTRNSRTAPVQSAGEELDTWIRSIDGILDLIDTMRTEKWDSDLDFDLDDLNDSDALVKTLNQKDPDNLRDRLREAATDTLQLLADRVKSSESNSTLYLRIWRELSQRHRGLNTRLSVPAGEVSLSKLHRILAQSVSKEPVETYAASAKKQSRVAVELWDGSPALPIQPSPTTFRFLKILHLAMSSAGNDLWGSDVIYELKAQTLHMLSTILDDDAYMKLAVDSDLTNGHADDAVKEDGKARLTNGVETNESRRDWLMQNLFDAQYLQCAFGHRGQGDSKQGDLSGVIKTLTQRLEIDTASSERLEKNASEYWRRTYLLFGLLSGH